MNINLNYLTICIVVGTLLSCDKDPAPINEEELITTIKVVLIGDGGDNATFTFKDIDGDGGNPPTIIGGTLKANQTYTATMVLLNEALTPSTDISSEIEAEGVDHQFFFEPTNTLVANLLIKYTDVDANGKPIGLSTTWETKNTSNGKVKIILRHQPDKNASGVSQGNSSNAGGETDIEVEFDVRIN